jgi:hypothetical protein
MLDYPYLNLQNIHGHFTFHFVFAFHYSIAALHTMIFYKIPCLK